jgi:signal transduction histidine kinase
MSAFIHRSLSRQFLIASFPVLLIGMLLIGSWVARQIESSVAYRIGGMTGMYVDSFISPHVQSLIKADDLSEADRAALDRLFTATALGEKIVSLKIWRRDGRVLYSNNKALMGRTFPVDEELQVALGGGVHSEMSDLAGMENEYERAKASRLIETYVPLHADGVGNVIAAAEFYHSTDELTRESRAAQLQSWVMLGATVAVMYLLLFALVRRGSQTIEAQQGQLNGKVTQLTALLAQNKELHDKVRLAAGRTAALNEVFLRRISSDLHDGPCQDMGLALMQFEALSVACQGEVHGPFSSSEAFGSIRTALRSALADLRAISAGLQLPEIDPLSLGEIAARAIRDYERKTGAVVTLSMANPQAAASLPVKITLYRLLQESLGNGFRHAGGVGQHIELKAMAGRMRVEVSDRGEGFDPGTVVRDAHLGLAGMRERVEILGGSFDVQSMPNQGTTVRVTLPLVVPGLESEQSLPEADRTLGLDDPLLFRPKRTAMQWHHKRQVSLSDRLASGGAGPATLHGDLV